MEASLKTHMMKTFKAKLWWMLGGYIKLNNRPSEGVRFSLADLSIDRISISGCFWY